ncbi:hypothetical protein Tco_1319461 [Tanacetum coccineum]
MKSISEDNTGVVEGKRSLYANFPSVNFGFQSTVPRVFTVIDNKGIPRDPAKIESLKIGSSPKTPTEIRVGYLGYAIADCDHARVPQNRSNLSIQCLTSARGNAEHPEQSFAGTNPNTQWKMGQYHN